MMGSKTRIVLSAGMLWAAGCDATPAPAPKASRVDSVVVAKPARLDLAEFCDVHAKPAHKPLAVPATDAPMAPAAGKPRWVNIWATWCKPCLEEMPRLSQFEKRLQGEGTAIALSFVSADEDAEALGAHLAAHPELPPTARLSDPAGLKPWLSELGLDAGAGLPVHVLTDAEGRVSCVRAGGVNDDHYAFVKDVFQP